jgi:hypothetical protein
MTQEHDHDGSARGDTGLGARWEARNVGSRAALLACGLHNRPCGRGSAGRASPCQGEGRGFESRRPLHEGPGQRHHRRRPGPRRVRRHTPPSFCVTAQVPRDSCGDTEPSAGAVPGAPPCLGATADEGRGRTHPDPAQQEEARRDGWAAEYVAIEARSVAPKPATLDFVGAAAIPQAGAHVVAGALRPRPPRVRTDRGDPRRRGAASGRPRWNWPAGPVPMSSGPAEPARGSACSGSARTTSSPSTTTAESSRSVRSTSCTTSVSPYKSPGTCAVAQTTPAGRRGPIWSRRSDRHG